MSDQITAALITGTCGIIAAVIGLLRWRRRERQRQRLLNTGHETPIFAAARAFAKSTTVEQQRKAIQQIEVALSHGSLLLSGYQMEQCAGSDWELDRIGLYLYEEYTAQPNQAARALHVQHEWDRLKVAATPRSTLPLLYSVRSLERLVRQQPHISATLWESTETLYDIKQHLHTHSHLDPDKALLREVDRLLARLCPQE